MGSGVASFDDDISIRDLLGALVERKNAREAAASSNDMICQSLASMTKAISSLSASVTEQQKNLKMLADQLQASQGRAQPEESAAPLGGVEEF
eukprot:scaffold3011_cov265-Pinguiococcus_pyrenoidosus.AAC.1